MKRNIFISIYIVLFNLNTYAQFPAKWIIKTEPNIFDFKTNIQIENDSIFKIEQTKIIEKLNSMGYFQPKLNTEFIENQLTTIIVLGKKINYTQIENNIDIDLSSYSFSKKLDDGKYIIPVEKVKYLIADIEKSNQDLGYPFTKVYFSNQTISNDTMLVQLNIEKGEKRILDKIIIEGYKTFPRKFLKNIYLLEENQTFNQTKVNNISKNLRNIPFINENRKPELFFTQDSTYLFLYFDKKKMNTIDGIIGFSNKQNGKGIKLDGHFKLELLNSLNKGEYFYINWISDGMKTQNFKSNITIPYIMGTYFSFDEEIEMFKKDSTFFNLKTQHKIDYNINPNSKISLQYTFHQSNTLANNLFDNFKNYTSNFVGLSYSYSKWTSNSFFPKKFSVINTLQNGKRGNEKQWQWEMYSHYLWEINSKNKITLNQELRYLSSKQTLDNELYRIGGINNLRGIAYKSIPTSKYICLQTDYHFINSDKTVVSILTDQGYFEDTLKERNYIYGIGLGYQIFTENNIFQLQYLLEKSKNTPFSLKNSFLNLSISQNF